MKKETCIFLKNAKRCTNRRVLPSCFCVEHKKRLKNTDNKALLELITKGIRDGISITEEKKIGPKLDIEIWDNFTNYMNELLNRGYTLNEILLSAKSITDTKGFFNDIYKQLKLNPKWKKFEKIVAGIHMLEADGAKIKYDDKICGKRTQRKRQIDVSLKFFNRYYEYLAIIECKDKIVSIGEAEAFRTKIEDVGANKGVMVSSKGFQEGAKKAAEAHNIELFTLTEETADWTTKIRKDIIRVPFPTNIEFKSHDALPSLESANRDVSIDDFFLYVDENEIPTSLRQILDDVCEFAINNKISLPRIMDINFGKEFLVQLPERRLSIPVYGMKVKLVQFEFKSSKKIDIPPKVETYVYSDIIKERKYKIPAKIIPKVKEGK